MRKSINLAFIISTFSLTATLAQKIERETIALENPVRSALDDKILSIPDLNTLDGYNVTDQYSGYLAADVQKTSKFMHYWFITSQSSKTLKNNDDPIIVWTGGKPGCSTMVNLLKEIGPFALRSDGKLVVNHYTWNKDYNLLFLDDHSMVGYSYATGFTKNSVGQLQRASDDSMIEEDTNALSSFLTKFPELKQNPIYLAGERFAGYHLPKLALNLVKSNPSINLKGVILSNPMLDSGLTQEAIVYFSYHHGLIDTYNWRDISESCCGGKVPARGRCNFQNATSACLSAVQSIIRILSGTYFGLNPENLYGYCANYASETLIAEDMLPAICAMKPDESDEPEAIVAVEGGKFSALLNFLNRDDVRRAIHIPEGLKRTFETCNQRYAYKYNFRSPYIEYNSVAKIKELLDYDKRKLTLLLYNGDVDLTYNFIGNKWFIEDLKRPIVKPHTAWYCNDRLAGFTTQYDRCSFSTVTAAGGAPAFDRPRETRIILDEFIRNYGNARIKSGAFRIT